MAEQGSQNNGGGGLGAAGWTNIIAGGLTGVLGYIQQRNARKALEKLNRTPLPKYALTNEVQNSINEADRMRGQGYTTAETNAYQQNAASQNNLAYNRAFNQAPTLSNAIQAGIQSNNLNAQLKLAAMDAQMRRNNIMYSDQLRGQTQNIANLNTGAELQRRNMAEQNWGKAGQAGYNNLLTGATLLAGAIPGGVGAATQKKKKMGFGYDNSGYGQGDIIGTDLYSDQA